MEGLAETLKIKTAVSSSSQSKGGAAPNPGGRSEVRDQPNAANASMKTGIASTAQVQGPPRTAAPAATTRLPVMCAVKIAEGEEAREVNHPGNDVEQRWKPPSNRASAIASSAGRIQDPEPVRISSDVDMFLRLKILPG